MKKDRQKVVDRNFWTLIRRNVDKDLFYPCSTVSVSPNAFSLLALAFLLLAKSGKDIDIIRFNFMSRKAAETLRFFPFAS
ncbi:hypothetical protein MNBD_CHLOROFLEXI01-4309 [hydrothermal vent metagenome]|uniref:Uncharacterized protein n=1 Tax=hydrothermal vent metagenome TaxID=652676 RepID=A0A3B0VII6_9ZZZZ